MRDEGLTGLVVYGNSKINGSVRYLSGYWPDRGGWLAVGPQRSDIRIFDGATLVVPQAGEAVLVFDKGQLLDREACTKRTTTSGFGGELAEDPPVARAIASILTDAGAAERVGIETWDKFPAPMYLELKDALPAAEIVPSTVVEELALIKSPWEIDIFRQAAKIGDEGHRAFEEALRDGLGKSELELIRMAESVMREANPIYEEPSPISPSLISSGRVGRLGLLHVPLGDKPISRGDAVNWDLAMRYHGYPVDTSRTRVMGKATPTQVDAYGAALAMSREVIAAVRPGVEVQDLVRLADDVAKDFGYELWDRFLGHGLGLDVHGRPDMGLESMALQENMLITVEPRIAVDDTWLFGNEEMVLVTASGCEVLTSYPTEPLELAI
jgi:Xaa-Pro aminopeptidase